MKDQQYALSEFRAIATTTVVFAALFTLGAVAVAVLALVDPPSRRVLASFSLLSGAAAVCFWAVWAMVRRTVRALEQQSGRGTLRL